MDDVGCQGASVEFKGKGTHRVTTARFVAETIGQRARLCKKGFSTAVPRPWSSRAIKRRPVRLRIRRRP
jgi:hypothetical protein